MTLVSDLVEPRHRSEWPRLAEQSGSIYSTPEWLETWWRHFGNGRRLIVDRVRDRDGRTVAILPLYLWSSFPLRVLRFVGHGPSDALGAICAPQHRHLAVAAVREIIHEEGIDVFVGEELPDGEEWTERLGGQLLRRHQCPVLRIEGRDWERFLASHGRAMRQKLRAGERKIARAGLSYRLTSSRQDLDRDMDALFSLHAARFPRGTSEFGWDKQLQAFHREFARLALSRGWLRLRMLEREGEPIAAHYGFCYGNAHYGYNGGWRPSYARLTPGRVLLLYAIRQAFEEGVAEFRFLRGAEPYKYWFANADAPVDTISVTNGVIPRVVLDAYFRSWKLGRARVSRKLARARATGIRRQLPG